MYSFEVVEVGETGKALYGTNAAGEPWLLLRSGGHLDAQVSLPDTTLEIWSQALEYTTTQSGRYTVNWENLGQLWIDSGAFYSSQLGGDITLSDSCYLASYAVYNCDQLTSVTMGDNIGQIGEGTFGGCDSLTTAQFGTMQDSVALYSGLFNDCNQLTSITINDYTAPSLVVLGTSGFQFNFGWTLVIFLRQIVSAGGSAAVTAVDPGVWNPDPERRKAHKDPSGKRKTGGGCHIFERCAPGCGPGADRTGSEK